MFDTSTDWPKNTKSVRTFPTFPSCKLGIGLHGYEARLVLITSLQRVKSRPHRDL